MKKLLSIALSLCLLLSVALADVTLTKVYKTEDLVSSTFHNGFVTAIGMTGENTVVLKDDGTYEYTKRLSNREIAEQLFLSEGSVKQYINQIYSKLLITGDVRTKRKRLAELAAPKS